MRFNTNLLLADVDGQPLSEHIHSVLRDLLPRFKRTFPQIRDDAQVSDILEGAGQRIAAREKQLGRVSELHRYAWVALKNAAVSVQRRSEGKIQSSSMSYSDAEWLLGRLSSTFGSPGAIEQCVLLKQALDLLTPEERLIAIRRQAGFSDREIAEHVNTSAAAIGQKYFRMLHRVRKILALGRTSADDRFRDSIDPE